MDRSHEESFEVQEPADRFRIRELKREKQIIKDHPQIKCVVGHTKLAQKIVLTALDNHQPVDEFQYKCELRWKIYDSLKPLIGGSNNVKLLMVGPCSTFTGFKSCDLDLSLILRKQKDCGEMSKFANLLIFQLREKHPQFTNFAITKSTQSLTLKFVDSSKDLKININFDDKQRVWQSALIRTYVLLDFRVSTLILAVKDFARKTRINDMALGGLSSDCLELMTISYLQIQGVLPVLDDSLIEFDPDNPYPLMYEHDYEEESDCDIEIDELYHGFIQHYCKYFNSDPSIVSVRANGSIKPGDRNAQFYVEMPFTSENGARSVQTKEDVGKIIDALKKVDYILKTYDWDTGFD